MDLEARLQRELHGALVGRMGRHVLCDHTHTGVGPMDPETPICYDTIRVGEITLPPQFTPSPDRWVLDAARCLT